MSRPPCGAPASRTERAGRSKPRRSLTSHSALRRWEASKSKIALACSRRSRSSSSDPGLVCSIDMMASNSPTGAALCCLPSWSRRRWAAIRPLGLAPSRPDLKSARPPRPEARSALPPRRNGSRRQRGAERGRACVRGRGRRSPRSPCRGADCLGQRERGRRRGRCGAGRRVVQLAEPRGLGLAPAEVVLPQPVLLGGVLAVLLGIVGQPR